MLRTSYIGSVHAGRQALYLRENGGRRSSTQAAGWVERINAQQLVNQAASDAHHRGTAVVALSVELEGLLRGIRVAEPDVTTNVSWGELLGLGLGEGARGNEQEAAVGSASLRHAGDNHDLQPARGGGSLKGSEAVDRHVGELEARRRRQVAGEAEAGMDGDHVEEAKHRSATVLDLHDLIAAHVARGDETKRVEYSERRGDTDIALSEHGDIPPDHQEAMKSAAVVALALLESVQAFQAPAAVRATGSSAISMFAEGDVGVTPPLGVFDPLGLIATRNMRRYEIMEIKHGRAAMLVSCRPGPNA